MANNKNMTPEEIIFRDFKQLHFTDNNFDPNNIKHILGLIRYTSHIQYNKAYLDIKAEQERHKYTQFNLFRANLVSEGGYIYKINKIVSLQIDSALEKELFERGLYKISPSIRIPMVLNNHLSNTTCIVEAVALNENISNQMVNIIDQCNNCDCLDDFKKMLQSGEYTFFNVGDNVFYDIIEHKQISKDVE